MDVQDKLEFEEEDIEGDGEEEFLDRFSFCVISSLGLVEYISFESPPGEATFFSPPCFFFYCY